jgi:hypothetical protein
MATAVCYQFTRLPIKQAVVIVDINARQALGLQAPLPPRKLVMSCFWTHLVSH